MKDRTQIDLNRLRQIGWEMWNPIGLDADWKAAGPDEYDRYLWHVPSMSLRGSSPADAAAYLVETASQDMGLPTVDRLAAQATADAIAAYVESVRCLWANGDR